MTKPQRFTRHVRADSAEAATAEAKRLAARDGLIARSVATCHPCVSPGVWLVVLVVLPGARA